MQNSKSKGEISEAIIIASILKKGLSVSVPFGNNQRYDLIIDDGSNLLKAQCKTGRIRRGYVLFNSKSINGFTFKRSGYVGQIDFFLVYCPENEKIYKVPVREATGNSTGLRIKALERNTPRLNVKWADRYEF